MNDAKFWAKVERRADGCWWWLGARHLGYGLFNVSHDVSDRAHRFAYYQFRGPIPEGLTLDHLCRNPSCVNPDHLEAVTNRENIARGFSPTAINGRKTHCARGHEFTPENILPNKNAWRICRTCLDERNRVGHRRYQTDPAYRGRVLAMERARYAQEKKRLDEGEK